MPVFGSSVTFGFYDSVGGDRAYSAAQMSRLFDGIINDGVFMSIGTALMVSASTDMDVVVGLGRAWFNHTWTNNDAALPLTIDQSEVVLHRIDTVVLEIDANEITRANTIKILKGTPASVPVAPTLTVTEFVHQYPLAHIYVGAGVTAIIQANITNTVGTAACPFITGILSTINIDTLVAQWGSEFDVWLSTIADILDENTAGNLLNLINAKASFKAGSGTFSSGQTTFTVTDAFITALTQVIVSPTQAKIGAWSVASAAGSFTITSNATETGAVTFDWGATK